MWVGVLRLEDSISTVPIRAGLLEQNKKPHLKINIEVHEIIDREDLITPPEKTTTYDEWERGETDEKSGKEDSRLARQPIEFKGPQEPGEPDSKTTKSHKKERRQKSTEQTKRAATISVIHHAEKRLCNKINGERLVAEELTNAEILAGSESCHMPMGEIQVDLTQGPLAGTLPKQPEEQLKSVISVQEDMSQKPSQLTTELLTTNKAASRLNPEESEPELIPVQAVKRKMDSKQDDLKITEPKKKKWIREARGTRPLKRIERHPTNILENRKKEFPQGRSVQENGNNDDKGQRLKTNIFKVRIEEVGQLQNCFIRGHQMDANHQLYLEDVIIKRWGNTTDVHVFPCNTWLSPDVEIELQCLPEQGWDEDDPATLSVDGSTFESQSTSLPVSKTSSHSSLQSRISSSSSFDQFGDKGSRQRFNSQKKTPESGSSSSSLYSKMKYSTEEMETSECEPSFHCIGPGHVLGRLKQSHELKRQTLNLETTKGNSNGTGMGARLRPSSAPVSRPYSAPQLGQAGNTNYNIRTIDKRTLQTDKVSVLHGQKGSPNITGFGKTTPSTEVPPHCIDQSINKSNPPEKGINCAHEGQTKYNKGEKVEQCMASTDRNPNNASIVVPSEKPHLQEFSVGTVSKGFIIQGVENSNTSKSIIPHTKDNTENVIQENTMLWGQHSDTRDQGVVPDITCRMPLPLYNMFVGLVRDMASCSTVPESTKKGNCSDIENSLQDCHCNVGSNGAVQANEVEASNSRGDRGPKQINHDPGIIFINGSMQADSSLNAENTLSNTSAGDLSSSETEDIEFSISSALDFHGSLNSLDVHEEMDSPQIYLMIPKWLELIAEEEQLSPMQNDS
ncbi:uncharacterized protein [Ambystoma mexicanum]|uniref:uncharacterized protein n=1 Tax=Ambystoma mexicanum TaxID=8296 RepID=UPI0037E77BB3